MTDCYLGEIQISGFNFAPYQWATCGGQLMPIVQNTALFSLLGTTFGGDGKSNFGLPNYLNNAACSRGQGNGLTLRDLGESFGTESVTLLQSEMPAHTHGLSLHVAQDPSSRHGIPQVNDYLLPPGQPDAFISQGSPNTSFASNMIGFTGGSIPHENRQPFLALNFCIALSGIFPQRP